MCSLCGRCRRDGRLRWCNGNAERFGSASRVAKVRCASVRTRLEIGEKCVCGGLCVRADEKSLCHIKYAALTVIRLKDRKDRSVRDSLRLISQPLL